MKIYISVPDKILNKSLVIWQSESIATVPRINEFIMLGGNIFQVHLVLWIAATEVEIRAKFISSFENWDRGL